MLEYAINFEDDEGTFLVTCPDLPEVVTFRRNPQRRNPLRQRRDRGNNLRPFGTWGRHPRAKGYGRSNGTCCL